MDPSQFESLRTRLAVCKEQYNSSAAHNTRARKAAILKEIQTIESQLAQALGLQENDSDDEATTSNGTSHVTQPTVKMEKVTASSTPSLPSSASSSCSQLGKISASSSSSASPRTRSAPIDKEQAQKSKRVKLETPTSTSTSTQSLETTAIKPDPESSTVSSKFADSAIRSHSESSSTSHLASSVSDPIADSIKERESITTALRDAGEDIDDIEELLKAQQALERELAEKRRLREEEDERLARMLQDEEYQALSSASTAETERTGSTSNVTATVNQVLMSRAEKARQERADYEMAKLFAESEARSFNLSSAGAGRGFASASNSHILSSPASSSSFASPSSSSISSFTSRSSSSSSNPAFPTSVSISTSSSSSTPAYRASVSKSTSSSSSTPAFPTSLSQSTSSSSRASSLGSSSSITSHASQQQRSTTPSFSIFRQQTDKHAAASSQPVVSPYANYSPNVAKRLSEADKLKKNESDLRIVLSAIEQAKKAAAGIQTSSASGNTPSFHSALSTLRRDNSAGSSSSKGGSSNEAALRPPNLPPAPSSQAPVDLTKPRIDLTKQVVDLTDSVVDVPSGSEDYDSEDDGYGDYYGDGGSGSRYGWYNSSDEEEIYSDSEDLFGYIRSIFEYGPMSSRFYSPYGSSSYGSSSHYVKTYSESDIQKELQTLLSNIKAMEEIPPEDRLGTPEGMARNMVLLEHQKIGLTWLQKMEDGTNKGGILADDMGLGKTIQSIALIVSRRGQPPAQLQVWDSTRTYYAPPPSSALIKCKTTLIVAPVALVYQWENEIINKTTPGLLKVCVHYGGRKVKDAQELARYDVVITTYGVVSNEMGHNGQGGRRAAKPIGELFKLQFHRIILDEAQTIKNRATKAAISCSALQATYRWCLTGTPFQNKITELFSLIHFLRIRPYDEYTKFARDIANPIQKLKYNRKDDANRVSAMHRLQALLKAICLRRSKKDEVDGKPILHLPPRNVTMTNVEFSMDEASFYHALETRTVDRFNAYVKAGNVMKNYSNVLLLLLRLRQACCHPHLIKDFLKADEMDGDTTGDKHAKIEKMLDKLSEAIINRLLRDANLDAPECPICMDVSEHSVLLSKCGHIYCKACITTHLERHEPEDRKCPECRGLTRMEDTIPVKEFVNRYRPAPPAPDETDVKGKGKAVDNGNNGGAEPLPEVPVVLDDWISSAKIDKMVEIVQQVIAKREKVIVFSQFTDLLTLIERPLTDNNIPYLRYDGSVNPEVRNRIIQDFMNPTKDYPVILISLKCGSLGLNLVAANHVIMMDPWWNPAIENQAIDRAHRIGQTRAVNVYRLAVPNTVEDRIYRLQERKQALIDAALGESDEVPKLARLDLQDLIYLFRGHNN
ncbi:hypothetical protein BGW41_005246 [Actinomortierella wolfii]|nr:hypothetical protein BGW41_005246 [Actinomortierella wolfii]